jgi:hypothetical protein
MAVIIALALDSTSIIVCDNAFAAMVGIKPNGMDSSHFFGI